MAGELISFGIQKLWNLLSQECQRFQGVEDQVAELKRDLSLLSSFLKDADAKTHKSAVVKTCVEEIKEIICDAEDTIETFLLKQNLGKTSGIKMRIRRLACIIPDRRENSLDIAGIRTRISDVIEKMQKFGVQQMITDGGYMQPLRDRQRAMRQTFPTEDYESDFVGLEANVKELIGYLVEENNVQVVSVTGMGGLGKTTLARQIFNHEDVKRQFAGLAWVCVSQDCTQKNVWQKILVALKPKEEENKILQMTELTLQGELFRLLDTSKSLIVLDDIWNEGDWDLIKPIFSPTKGWKVLLTSRNESIAMRRNTTYINFKPKCLTTEDSWTLFQKIALPIRDASELEIHEEMEEMGKQMIKHCGGLPLAIKVLGGLLAAKYTLHDWKRLSENIASHLVGGRTDFNDENNNSVNYVLSLSFEELPSYLKHCFLYLAHFPEDYNIELKKLYYYWAAEGIYESRHYDGETIQDVGEVYIEELVRRNMVISEREATSLRFGYCHLHDMMREVCLLKAKEEKFFKIVTHPACSSSVHSQTSNQSRRLVVHTSGQDTRFNGEREIKNSKLRSLLFIPVEEYANFMMGSNFMELQLLRVLDLSGAVFKGRKLPSNIGKLIHLKYLSLYEAKVTHLPSSIGNLNLLLYLNLGVNDMGMDCHVPNVLKEMQELRYLHLPRSMHKKTKLELGGLFKLETLINFATKHSRVTDLHLMTRLRSLSINIEGCNVDTDMLASTLSKLRDLENLTLADSREWIDEKRSVLDCVLLKKPKSRMDITRLPKVQHFPSHLTTIELHLFYFEEDPMPILEKLLHLKEVKMHDSFARRMVCSGSGFPKLQKLELLRLWEMEEWIVEERSMPHLHTLVIWICPKLKEIPDGLRFLDSLKDLTMDRKWKERLSEGGADHDKVKHIPSVNYG